LHIAIFLLMRPYCIYVFLISLCTSIPLFAQDDDDILLTINEEEVAVKDFKRVYLKNLEIIQEDTQKDVRSYLDLFIEYKLKVQEAYRLELDQKKTYQKEFSKYRRQLSKGYLTDVNVSENLIKEAYNRTLEEINARHILVQIPQGGSADDTLKAYTKIQEARSRVLKGEDFGRVARQYSEDPSAKANGGELGWFKAFGMVYPFENAAYTTAVGEVSEPFRTSFGYHIVQTTATRASKGRVKVAHIMIALQQKDSTIDPEKRIREINTLLNQGESFEKLAKQYSDDKRSGVNGGVLLPFAQGQLSSLVFEEKAFALEEGETSAPFKSDFGWHITRLLKKIPVGSYEAERAKLEDRLKKDSRAKVISDSLMIRLRKRYTIPANEAVRSYYIQTIPDDALKAKKWKLDATAAEMSQTALEIRDTSITYLSVGKYLEANQLRYSGFPTKEAFVRGTIKKFEDDQIKAYHQLHLEEVDPDFAIVLNEYREGLLLFDLMETTIWNRAKEDSIVLQDYFTTNAANYQWPKRISLIEATSANKKDAERALSMLKEGHSLDTIETALNTANAIKVFFSKKTIPYDDVSLPETLNKTIGISTVFKKEDYTFYQINEILEAKPKTLEEARGQVISDYQTVIETEWIQKLKAQSKIDINKKLLKRLEKQLQ